MNYKNRRKKPHFTDPKQTNQDPEKRWEFVEVTKSVSDELVLEDGAPSSKWSAHSPSRCFHPLTATEAQGCTRNSRGMRATSPLGSPHPLHFRIEH